MFGQLRLFPGTINETSSRPLNINNCHTHFLESCNFLMILAYIFQAGAFKNKYIYMGHFISFESMSINFVSAIQRIIWNNLNWIWKKLTKTSINLNSVNNRITKFKHQKKSDIKFQEGKYLLAKFYFFIRDNFHYNYI